MGERGIAVRVLGLASTTRGFAFALTEGPGRLVSWGVHRTPPSRAVAMKALDGVLRRGRPLFVSFELEASRKKRHRGQMFGDVVTSACAVHGIMILTVESKHVKELANVPRPTKWDVADAIAKRFPEVAHKLPTRRKAWQSEDDRVGLFMALASAVSTWDEFRHPRKK